MINLLRDTIIQYVEVDPASIIETTSFVEDLHLNSYEIISIVGSVENGLGIDFPESDIRQMRTVGDVIEYINNKS